MYYSHSVKQYNYQNIATFYVENQNLISAQIQYLKQKLSFVARPLMYASNLDEFRLGFDQADVLEQPEHQQ